MAAQEFTDNNLELMTTEFREPIYQINWKEPIPDKQNRISSYKSLGTDKNTPPCSKKMSFGLSCIMRPKENMSAGTENHFPHLKDYLIIQRNMKSSAIAEVHKESSDNRAIPSITNKHVEQYLTNLPSNVLIIDEASESAIYISSNTNDYFLNITIHYMC